MCRLVSYLGPERSLSALLAEPGHGLVKQSYAPREMTDGLLNADGWGVAWFDPERSSRPGLLKGILPIWSDPNLATAGHVIAARSMLGVVRSATAGLDVSIANTPPYELDAWVFGHNGRLWPWDGRMVRRLRSLLHEADGIEPRGSTDSELIGLLWVSEIRRGHDAAEAARAVIQVLSTLATERGGGFTASMVLQRADEVIAVRHALAAPAPSLYLLEGGPAWPEAVLVASEPLDQSAGWRAIPATSLVRIHGAVVRTHPLD